MVFSCIYINYSPRLKSGLVRQVMDVASYYQLALGVERLRAPEVLFQPSILGIDQSGLSDCLEYVFSYYPHDLQQRLAQVHWLGGVLLSRCYFADD